MTPLRNLLVIGTNYLVDNKCINLDGGTDENKSSGHVFADIYGRRSVIIWQEIHCGEIKITVWWDYDHEKYLYANSKGVPKETYRTSKPLVKPKHYPKIVGAMVSGWLERQESKHLQGENNLHLEDTYIRRTNKIALEKLPKTDGKGFKVSGKYFR
ncbi:hypothetical protein [Lonsdalea quercina]|uniref:hypothetical protein n=1 Tax=Lonsdalea quercina TaxID=71657 RepID=UPI003975CD6A